MRWIVLFAMLLTFQADAASAKIYKVLPHFIDRNGNHALSPSLYERDAYQVQLRDNPEMRRGLRFDVHWKSRKAKTPRLRVEMRGGKAKEPTTFVAEAPLKPRWLSKWSSVTLQGEEYEKFGELLAWRATLWDGDQLLAEQKSFLW